MLKTLAHKIGRAYLDHICRDEYVSQRTGPRNERTIEFRFALECLAGIPETVLDVGAGTTAWPSLLRGCGYTVTAIDNVRDYWPDGMVNRHWHIEDVDITKAAKTTQQRFDAVTCISVLEHIEDHVTAVRNMAELLSPGGKLILTTPFSRDNPYPNVYRHPDALYGQHLPYICRSSGARELEQWMAMGLRLKRAEYWRLFTGAIWATGQRTTAWLKAQDHEPHQLGCFEFELA